MLESHPTTRRSSAKPIVETQGGEGIASPGIIGEGPQVVGIGASAGGIEALGLFFDAMPVDSGCAFVVVLHLDPKHESEMAHILSVRTSMEVVQIKDGVQLAANHVYVIAPDTDIEVRAGTLHVSKPGEPRGRRHPVDVLFRSLAADQHERAIAIVLSGTGSNGTDGLKYIRAEGGMSIAQTPDTAKFDGMPRSAISANLVDHVLTLEDMPRAILAFVRHGYVSAPAERSRVGRLRAEQNLIRSSSLFG
jgi:two-component system CheB/CheR fusion protein